MSTEDLGTLAGRWLAVQVWVGREHISATHLQMRGCDVFLPRYIEYRRWSDRIKPIDRALFAGYLFCRQSCEPSQKIVTAPGVIRIVGDGQKPLPVPDSEVEAVQRIVQTRLLPEPWPFLQVGQRVRIDAGPLSGTEGIVLMFKNRHRLVVSVPLLQRSIAVEIQSEWVNVAPSGFLERFPK